MRPARKYVLLLTGLLLVVLHARSQEEEQLPRRSEFKDPVTLFWFNTYGNIRISKHLFWVAQTHFRRQESRNTEFIGQWNQIYNRHAIGYIFSKNLTASLGGVLRVNFNTDEDEGERRTVPEWRIWHQYQFAIPFPRLVVYHRLRVEHRWTQGFADDSDYIFRNRWRYMFRMKIPINRPKLSSNTFYIGPEAELIMQSGRAVVDSPMEDLRLHTSFGYIINPRVTIASGFMYSFGQDLNDGGSFKQNYTLRFHVYFSPDIRKVKDKLPSIHLNE
ncbi:MAG: DUF2490 domain-containing protein [Bacteroidota bacterium]